MGRTNGSKNAADYYGGMRKATTEQRQPGGFRRLLAYFTPGNSRPAAERPSARASASFLMPWRSACPPADILTLDQGAPSFDALGMNDRWERVATDIIAAACQAPPSRQRSGSEGDDDDMDEEEEALGIYNDDSKDGCSSPERAPPPPQQRSSRVRSREDEYRAQPKPQPAPQPQQPALQPAEPLAALLPLARGQDRCCLQEATEDPAGQQQGERQLGEQRTMERRQQLAKLQQLQRQACSRDLEEHKPERLEYQAHVSPQRLQRQPIKHALLPTPPPGSIPLQHPYQAPFHRHTDGIGHPPPHLLQSPFQAGPQSPFLTTGLQTHGSLHPLQPSSNSLLQRQNANGGGGGGASNSRELLRLPQVRQDATATAPPPLVFRERAFPTSQGDDYPLRPSGTASRRFIDVAASAAAEDKAARQSGGGDGDGDGGRLGGAGARGGETAPSLVYDMEEDDAFLPIRTSLGGCRGGASFRRRGVFSDAGEGGGPVTPTRSLVRAVSQALPAAPSSGPLPLTPVTVTAVGATATAAPAPPFCGMTVAAPLVSSPSVTPAPPPPTFRRDNSARFALASVASPAAVTSVAATVPTTATAVSVNATLDSLSPPRQTSTSGYDSMISRAALLREACNGASSMRAEIQRMRTSNNGASGNDSSPMRRPFISSSGIPIAPAGAIPPTTTTDGYDSDFLQSDHSQGGSQPREPPVPGSNPVGPIPVGRCSNSGVSSLSIRVRHDLDNLVAAEGKSSAAEASGTRSGSPSVARSSRPRWQELLETAAAALDAFTSPRRRTGGGSQSGRGSSPFTSAAAVAAVDPESGGGPTSRCISRVSSNGGGGGGNNNRAAAPLPSGLLTRSDTCKDRTSRPVTPAACTGRVLQRAKTQPARPQSRFCRDHAEDDCDKGGESGDGTLEAMELAGTGAVPAATAAAAVAASGAAAPVLSSPRAGRRVLAPSTLSPTPPPPRTGVAAPAHPMRRISEVNATHAAPAVPPPPPGGAAAAGAAHAGSGGGAVASPRIALAERARERSGAATIPPSQPSACDSPPLHGSRVPLAATPSFGRRAVFADGVAAAADNSPPRNSSLQGGPIPQLPSASSATGSPPSPAGAGPLGSMSRVAARRVSYNGTSNSSSGFGTLGAGSNSSSGGGGGGPYNQLLQYGGASVAGGDAAGWKAGRQEGEVLMSRVSGSLEPLRLGGGIVGGGASLRPRRVGDMRLALAASGGSGSGSGALSGDRVAASGLWPVPPV